MDSCWKDFKRSLAGEIRQYCIRVANRQNILNPDDEIERMRRENVIILTPNSENDPTSYTASIRNADAVITVVSVSKVLKTAVGGGVGGAAIGAVGGGGAGAGIGALIGIVGGPIGVGIGAAIGSGVGIATGSATGTVPGAGIGGWLGKVFGKDIPVPLGDVLPRLGQVQSANENAQPLTVRIIINERQ